MMDHPSMRSIATLLVTALVMQGPPLGAETKEPEGESSVELEPTWEEAEKADEFVELAEDFEEAGDHDTAFGLYVQAYNLAPNRYGLAYKIGSLAFAAKRCDTAEQYLNRFLEHGELLLYAKELKLARDMLYELEIEGCKTQGVPAPNAFGSGPNSEIREPLPPSTPPQSRSRSKASVAAGGTLVGVGLAALVAGLVLLGESGLSNGAGETGNGFGGTGPNCTVGKPCGATCISVEDTCHIGSTDGGSSLRAENPDLATAGGVLIFPISAALVVTGSVLLVKGRQHSALTVTPTGLSLKF
jgi:hypothetical protein